MKAIREGVNPDPALQVFDRRVDVPSFVSADAVAEGFLSVLREVIGIARRGRGPVPQGQEPRDRFENGGDSKRVLEVLLDAVVLLEILGDAPASINGAHHDDGNAPVLRASLDASRDIEPVKL